MRHCPHRFRPPLLTASTTDPTLPSAVVGRMSVVAMLLVESCPVRPVLALGVRAVAPVQRQPVPGPARRYSPLRACSSVGSSRRAPGPALVSTRHPTQCPPVPVQSQGSGQQHRHHPTRSLLLGSTSHPLPDLPNLSWRLRDCLSDCRPGWPASWDRSETIPPNRRDLPSHRHRYHYLLMVPPTTGRPVTDSGPTRRLLPQQRRRLRLRRLRMLRPSRRPRGLRDTAWL